MYVKSTLSLPYTPITQFFVKFDIISSLTARDGKSHSETGILIAIIMLGESFISKRGAYEIYLFNLYYNVTRDECLGTQRTEVFSS